MVFHVVLLSKVEGGSIGGDGSGLLSSLSMSSHTYPHVLQLWFYVLTDILNKTLAEADMELEPRGKPTTVDDQNAWTCWIFYPGSDWILHGDSEPLCLLCLDFLSGYLLYKH